MSYLPVVMLILTPEIRWNEQEPIQSIDFQPNSNRLVTASTNKTIRVSLM